MWIGVSSIPAEVTFRVKVITFARSVVTLVNCQQQSYQDDHISLAYDRTLGFKTITNTLSVLITVPIYNFEMSATIEHVTGYVSP